MKIDDIKTFLDRADDDHYTANIMSKQYRKPIEIICGHRIQGIEKYLKAFLEYNNITPDKTHNIKYLLSLCIKINENFKSIIKEARIIDKYSDFRYQSSGQVDEADMKYCLSTLEKVKSLPVFETIRKEIAQAEDI